LNSWNLFAHFVRARAQERFGIRQPPLHELSVAVQQRSRDESVRRTGMR
jgi:hypothetical protein